MQPYGSALCPSRASQSFVVAMADAIWLCTGLWENVPSLASSLQVCEPRYRLVLKRANPQGLQLGPATGAQCVDDGLAEHSCNVHLLDMDHRQSRDLPIGSVIDVEAIEDANLPLWRFGDKVFGILVARSDDTQPLEVAKDPSSDVLRDRAAIGTRARSDDKLGERICTAPWSCRVEHVAEVELHARAEDEGLEASVSLDLGEDGGVERKRGEVC